MALIQNIYEETQTTFQLQQETQPIKIHRGVRQDELLLPKLFVIALEDIF